MTLRISKHFASALAFAVAAFPALGQQFVDPELPAEFVGHWRLVTDNGFTGEVSVTDKNCNYSISSSFAHFSGSCYADWIDPGLLTIGTSQTESISTSPSYQPQSALSTVETTSGVGFQPFVLNLDDTNSEQMNGHIIGTGDHAHVTLSKN